MGAGARPAAVVFAYHNVGVRCLKVLLAGGVDVRLVVTHEDNPAEAIWFESVAALCRAEGIAHITPSDANSPELLERVRAAQPDLMFSFYYRNMLPALLLAVAPAFNMHGSLLPQFRGRAPVNWAVLHGAGATGASLHEMTVKPDAGAIVAQTAVPILPDDTAFEVFGKVTVAAEQTLWAVLPALLDGSAARLPNDLTQGGYFGGRKPEDGRIDWNLPAQAVYNLHRAVAPPYPGAFTVLNGITYIIQAARISALPAGSLPPGLAVVDNCIFGVCGDGRMLAISALTADGAPHTPAQLRAGLAAAAHHEHYTREDHMKKVLILGVNGFIGHHLSKRILETTDWHVYGMDMMSDRISELLDNASYKSRMHFFEGDITINKEWVEYHVKKCDVILPLVAIATPSTYVKQPLRVFELDFEANLPIVRSAAKYGKHLVFPSTSEVYGMCHDEEFDPENSELICGPINKPRWIYSNAKQLMDRVIWGYGMEGLNFTLFRPFNWIGAGLDSIHTPKEGSSRVVTQFFGHIVRGENISLVDGGAQKRAFTYIDDGIDALIRIIANKDGVASGKIYNIGNPTNNYSIRELAGMMLTLAAEYPEYADGAKQVKIVETTSGAYYGAGYQDVQNRVPKITNTCAELGWAPTTNMADSLRNIFDAYRSQVAEAKALMD